MLAAEKAGREQAEKAVQETRLELEAEKAAGEELTRTLAAVSEEKESLTAALAEEKDKTSALETQVSELTVQNQDLKGVKALEEQAPLELPDPNRVMVAVDDLARVTWSRVRLNEEGLPQLWLRASDNNGLMSMLFYRSFTDQNNQLQTELYDRYPLSGDSPAVRFRTLSKPGAYAVVVLNRKGDYVNFGILATVEDVDGNGVIDTVTDAEQTVTLLNLPGAFSAVGAENP